MEIQVRINKGVVWELVDDQAIVVQPGGRVAYVLNPTAARIWTGLAEGLDVAKIAAGLAQACGRARLVSSGGLTLGRRAIRGDRADGARQAWRQHSGRRHGQCKSGMGVAVRGAKPADGERCHWQGKALRIRLEEL